jgi:hypothetical protein
VTPVEREKLITNAAFQLEQAITLARSKLNERIRRKFQLSATDRWEVLKIAAISSPVKELVNVFLGTLDWNFSGMFALTDAVFSAAISPNTLRSLRVLKLSSCPLTDQLFLEIAPLLPKLEFVDLFFR